MEQLRAICMLPWPRAEVCVCTCVRVWLSWKRAATHLEVSVHNIMLVDMIDTLQDLTNAVTTEREKRGQRERVRRVSHHPSLQKEKKNTTHLPHMTRLPGRKKKRMHGIAIIREKKQKPKDPPPTTRHRS